MSRVEGLTLNGVARPSLGEVNERVDVGPNARRFFSPQDGASERSPPTQGDKLRALKGRRPLRSDASAAVRYFQPRPLTPPPVSQSHVTRE